MREIKKPEDIEVTDEMIRAGWDASPFDDFINEGVELILKSMYRAMRMAEIEGKSRLRDAKNSAS